MGKVERVPDIGIAEIAMITHRIFQMMSKFRHSSLQIAECMVNGQVSK